MGRIIKGKICQSKERFVMRYNSVLDLHTHTVASGHAYCSLREMAKAAADKGLEVLGITEHAPAMPGTCHKYYFENLKIVPREMYGIQLLLGSEVNILDAQGTVDLVQRTLERMDVVIASLHMPCMKPGSKLYEACVQTGEYRKLSECDEESVCKYYRASG